MIFNEHLIVGFIIGFFSNMLLEKYAGKHRRLVIPLWLVVVIVAVVFFLYVSTKG
jgi:hypothetical protein